MKKKKNLHGLGPAQLTQLQGFSPGLKKPHQERHIRIWTFYIRNSDIFQKLLRSSHLFFLSSIFTSGTLYLFVFSTLLLISVGNCENRK
jgi:hypothetical protein